MRSRTVLLVMTSLFVPAIQAQSAAPPDVSGTWVDTGNPNVKWILAAQNGSMHLQEMNGDDKVADFTCSLSGQECKAKEEGRVEKITMYYNGPKLVTIKERGDQVLKERIFVSDDGKTLQVERVPLDKSQKAETRTFRRQTSNT